MTPATVRTQLQLALMALTRLPAGRIDGDVPPLGAAAWAFPVVGMIVGAIAGVVFWGSGWLGLPPLAAALLAIATSVLITGGLHEDGLADMADGFGGGRDKSRKLEIMRDSRLGSYGALAMILVVGLTATAMAEAGNLWAFIAIGAVSRTAMLLPLMLLPPARPDGLGASAAASINPSFWVAFFLTLLLSLFALPLWTILVASALTFSVMALAKAQIGGQTGDILGATQKLVECAAWLTLAAVL